MTEQSSEKQVLGKVTEMDRYLFDLKGYLVIRRALSKTEVTDCNGSLDEMQDCKAAILCIFWRP